MSRNLTPMDESSSLLQPMDVSDLRPGQQEQPRSKRKLGPTVLCCAVLVILVVFYVSITNFEVLEQHDPSNDHPSSSSSSSSSSTPSTSTSVPVDSLLRKYEIPDETLVCNDGSPGIYYARETESDRWLLYVEGGFLYCWDSISCDARYASNPELMSSTLAEDVKDPEGLMNDDCDINPHWCDANVGYIFYCSSDYFTGTAAAEDTSSGYHFRGWDMLTTTIDLLLTEHGLNTASEVLLSGKGGGGVTLMFGADRMVEQIRSGLIDENVPLKVVVDTGFVTDYAPFDAARDPCVEYETFSDCNIRSGVEYGMSEWAPALSDYCVDQGYTWQCLFGTYVFEAVFADLDVYMFAYQYDSAQLATDGAADMTDPDMAAYAENAAEMLMEDLSSMITFGMFPGCYGHEIMDDDDFNHVFFEEVSFNDAVHQWWTEGTGDLYYDTNFTVNINPNCL